MRYTNFQRTAQNLTISAIFILIHTTIDNDQSFML